MFANGRQRLGQVALLQVPHLAESICQVIAMADGAGDGHLTLHAARAFFVIILRREHEDISVTIVETAMSILEVRYVVIH